MLLIGMQKKLFFILLALLVVLPLALSLDSNIPPANSCNIKEYINDKCTHLNGASMEEEYSKYVNYCAQNKLNSESLDNFTKITINCFSPQGTQLPLNEKPVNYDPMNYINLCCNNDSSSSIPFDVLFDGYLEYCANNKISPIPPIEFKNVLSKTGYSVVQSKNGVVIVNGLLLKSNTLSDSNNSLDLFSSTNLLIILVIIILLLIAAMIFFSFFFIKMKQNEVIKEMDSVKQKMVALERTYLKGKMDQQTYRKLMQEYQLRMTELELEIAKLKKKSPKNQEVEKD